MAIDRDSIRVALTRVMHPGAKMNIVDAGAVAKISYCDGYASIRIHAGGTHADQQAALKQQVTAATRLHAQQAGVELVEVHVELTDEVPTAVASAASRGHEPIGGLRSGNGPSSSPAGAQGAAANAGNALPNVKHIIAVGAGKGGVGKSTIAVNIAVGLARRGHAVGLMDGDIYGPSLPTMLGLGALDASVLKGMLQPFLVHGVKAMTIGKLVEPDKPLIWRGPMAHGAFKQLVEQTSWGELDYLVIDLPPGTGDVALTMAQMLRLTGAVVVCTPQKVAQDDAVRAARMFQQLGVEVLGVVENMSYFIADDGTEYDLFGRGGAQMMAQRLGLPFLGAVPINMALRQRSDSGEPIGNFTDTSERNAPLASALEGLITTLEGQVALSSLKQGQTSPTLSIS